MLLARYQRSKNLVWHFEKNIVFPYDTCFCFCKYKWAQTIVTNLDSIYKFGTLVFWSLSFVWLESYPFRTSWSRSEMTMLLMVLVLSYTLTSSGHRLMISTHQISFSKTKIFSFPTSKINLQKSKSLFLFLHLFRTNLGC